MEGLEVSENLFSHAKENKDFRVDSQFFTQEPIKNPRLIYDKIGNCLINAQYGISIAMNEDGIGYPIYRMNEIHSMMCDLEVDKTAELSNIELATFELNDRDVLFNRTNSFKWVGRTGVYRKIDDRKFVFASYLVRFIPDESKIIAEYLTAFLNTKAGVADIKRRARQSVNQTNVNPEEVKAIEIPLLSMAFQVFVKNCFDQAHTQIIKSKKSYQTAEQLLLQEIGLADFKTQKTNNYQEISLSNSLLSTSRLDSEYYHPKALFVINQIKNKRYFLIKELFNLKNGFPWKSDQFRESGEGAPFVRIRNCKPGYIENESLSTLDYNYARSIDFPKAKEGDIVIGMDGIKYFYGSLVKNSVYLNQRVCHLIPKETSTYSSELVLLMINSIVGQTQLMREMTIAQTVGHINNESIGNVMIPKLDQSIKDKITNYIEDSHASKKRSEHLLEVAKRAVEIAIEETEEVAMEYIQSNSKL